jgi:hypothetical protein
MTALAGDALADAQTITPEIFRDILQGGVTGGAAGIGGGILDFQGIGNLFGPRGRERGGGTLGMEVLDAPHQKLILGLASTTVAAAAGAGIGAEKSGRLISGSCVGNMSREGGDKTAIKCFTHDFKLVNSLAA